MAFIKNFYPDNRFFKSLMGIIALFVLSFILEFPTDVPKILFIVLLAFFLADLILLFRIRQGVVAHRALAEKLSNGDENEIKVYVENHYPFKAHVTLIDEIPYAFQLRDLELIISLAPGENKTALYYLRPVKRGEYSFGTLNLYVQSPLRLVKRRFRFSEGKVVPVYPSYIQMRKYELMAISNRLNEVGIKKIRRIGHNMEFELIRDYVAGDDIRTINWKATARKTGLMVNHYQDERSQQVYSVIDKGRTMQMPFQGMSLLDYAINASLVISNIAIKKSDKAGLITFQDNLGTLLPASRRNNQMSEIMEALYNQKTGYRESDFSTLYTHVRRKINQRSLLLLFTNFESVYGLQRQLPFLIKMSQQHLLTVIFFENTEIQKLIERPAQNLQEVYHKTMAEKFVHDKKLIINELHKHGLQAILTKPENLTVATINKYLELKARGMI